MATILKGAPVAAALDEKTSATVASLRKRGIIPVLAIVRVGSRKDDLSYERAAIKRATALGISVRHVVMPENIGSCAFLAMLDALSADSAVHGILLFRPLPESLDEREALSRIVPSKDVDGCTAGSLAGVFMNTPIGFTPCTAQAVMELLAHYGIGLAGKRVTVIGRSLVVGRPLAMLLTHQNATVTLCHTKTADVPAISREADIVAVCCGQTDSVGASFFSAGQTVIDVGIGRSESKNKLCGDVRFEEAEPLVSAITPVPGGIGSVTTSVLMHHLARAAERIAESRGV